MNSYPQPLKMALLEFKKSRNIWHENGLCWKWGKLVWNFPLQIKALEMWRSCIKHKKGITKVGETGKTFLNSYPIQNILKRTWEKSAPEFFDVFWPSSTSGRTRQPSWWLAQSRLETWTGAGMTTNWGFIFSCLKQILNCLDGKN